VGTPAALLYLLGYVLAGVLLKTGVSASGAGEDSIWFASLAIGTLSIGILIIQVAPCYGTQYRSRERLFATPLGSDSQGVSLGAHSPFRARAAVRPCRGAQCQD
jgi:hypothetical protein